MSSYKHNHLSESREKINQYTDKQYTVYRVSSHSNEVSLGIREAGKLMVGTLRKYWEKVSTQTFDIDNYKNLIVLWFRKTL